MARKIKTQDRQGPLDIALQEYGSTEGVFQLMLDNPSVERVDQFIPAGTTLIIGDVTFNKEVRDKYKSTNKKIVSMTYPELLQYGDFDENFIIDFN